MILFSFVKLTIFQYVAFSLFLLYHHSAMKMNTKKTLRFFWKHISRFRLILSVMMVSLICAVVASMLFPFLYKNFFNAIASGGDRGVVFEQLVTIVLLILALDLAEWACWRVSQFLNNYLQPRNMANILNECFEYLHLHSYNFFNSSFSGALVKRVNRMARAFEALMDKFYWDLIPMAIRVFMVLVVMSYLQPMLGIIAGVWIVLFVSMNYFLSVYKLKFDLEKSKADTKVTANLADTITNAVNIRLFSALPFEKNRFNATTDDWFRKTKKSWNVGSIIEALQALLMVGLNFLILYFAAKYWKEGFLTVGDFALIQAYLLEIFHQLWNFGRIIRDIHENLAEAEEMTVILETPHEVRDASNAPTLVALHGKVEFRNVNFSYDKFRDVISDLSFSVKPGEKIALVGPSGGGKTTITKLLLRLFDVQTGEILIDGQNIAQVTQESLHEQVALVPQDPILFHRTLMENIRYGRRDASDEEVMAAARMANCHEFIGRFPRGYETYVGERGVKLSGGERQRVAIARAILSNARILILDEATSNLDSHSESLIQEALLALMKQKTSFVIAHRLSTILKMDRVFVLQDGRIVEEGDHASLVTKKDSLYKKFWDLQAGGYMSGD